MSASAAASDRKLSPNRIKRQRQGLLALVHIAKKDLGLSEDEYRAGLGRFGAGSAAALSVAELEKLVTYYQSLGWRKKPADVGGKRHRFNGGQIDMLQARCQTLAAGIENGEKRLGGLIKKHCGVDDVRFAREAAGLKRVLRVLGALRAQGNRLKVEG